MDLLKKYDVKGSLVTITIHLNYCNLAISNQGIEHTCQKAPLKALQG